MEDQMKVVLLMGALCGNFYQNSAIAKDQDGIVMFGGGNLGCAKNPVGQPKNNEWHVKCGLGNNVIIDLNSKTTISCMGYFEGNWKLTEGQIIYKNKNINNDNFICYRYAYNPAFGLDKVVASDVSSHSYSPNLTPMLVTYDVLSATVHVCIVPYYDMEMACMQEKTPPSRQAD
jgi:hypothetical protein